MVWHTYPQSGRPSITNTYSIGYERTSWPWLARLIINWSLWSFLCDFRYSIPLASMIIFMQICSYLCSCYLMYSYTSYTHALTSRTLIILCYITYTLIIIPVIILPYLSKIVIYMFMGWLVAERVRSKVSSRIFTLLRCNVGGYIIKKA